MDLPWGSDKSKQFITNVGLVTSKGPYGDNVMACEWTHHVSYSPGLVAVCVGHGKATYENIKASKEFGVSIASKEQAVMCSVAGGNTGKEVDKVKALEELGFKFSKGKKINVLMVKDAVLNLECKLFKEIPLGDHTMFVGEAVEASLDSGKKPLALHNGSYGEVNFNVPKPSQEEREKTAKIVQKYKKE